LCVVASSTVSVHLGQPLARKSRQMPPYALINLSAVSANYRILCTKAASARTGAVVKANAYGLGMIPVARILEQAGCTLFFTANIDEAITLRTENKTATIIPLNGIEPAAFDTALAQNITPMLNNLAAIKAWATFASAKGRILPAMIHLDTGMNRLGLSSAEQKHLTAHPDLLSGISVQAWSSHFACADMFDNPMTPLQRQRLQTVLQGLPKAPVSLCNSSGIFWGEDYHYDIVRPGVALYGGNPTPHLPNPMRPVIELHTTLLQVHEAEAGTTVGYNATRPLTRKSRIATIEAGYADGMHRTLRNKGSVMIGEHTAPVVGGISMDLITLDVTDVPESVAHVGANVTLIGPHRPIDVIAAEAGTISYEILTSLGPRVRRDYLRP